MRVSLSESGARVRNEGGDGEASTEREGRQPAAIEDEQLESATGSRDATPPYDPSTFDGMDQQLVRAIEGLAAEYQVVLMLWAVDELSYKEIAAAVGIPIGTVMSRLHRGRRQLQQRLWDYALEHGLVPEPQPEPASHGAGS